MRRGPSLTLGEGHVHTHVLAMIALHEEEAKLSLLESTTRHACSCHALVQSCRPPRGRMELLR